MESPKSKADLSESVLLALAAALIVAILLCYRPFASHPGFVSTTLQFGSQQVAHDASAATFLSSFNSPDGNAHFVSRVLEEPQVQNLKSVRESSDPERWLSRHVRLRRIGRGRIEVTATARTNTDELKVVVETVTESIRNDAATSGVPVAVVSRFETQ